MSFEKKNENNYEDEYIDIIGLNVECTHCGEVFYVPDVSRPPTKYTYGSDREYRLMLSNGAYDYDFGYFCARCKDIRNIVDIYAAKQGLCMLSETSVFNNYEFKISSVAKWNNLSKIWDISYSQNEVSTSTLPLVGDSFLFVFGFSEDKARCLLKKQPTEILLLFSNIGVPLEQLPYRKLKVHKRLTID